MLPAAPRRSEVAPGRSALRMTYSFFHQSSRVAAHNETVETDETNETDFSYRLCFNGLAYAKKGEISAISRKCQFSIHFASLEQMRGCRAANVSFAAFEPGCGLQGPSADHLGRVAAATVTSSRGCFLKAKRPTLYEQQSSAHEQRPGDASTQHRQQQTEHQKSCPAADVVDHPVEVHAEKAGEKGDGKEDHGYHREPRDLLALLLGNARSMVAHDIGQPLATFVQPMLKVFHLVGVVVQLCRTALVHARHNLDADNCRSDKAAVPFERRPDGLACRQRLSGSRSEVSYCCSPAYIGASPHKPSRKRADTVASNAYLPPEAQQTHSPWPGVLVALLDMLQGEEWS
jgi:hypothetical protein